MKILVTGGTGFVGSYILRYLVDRYEGEVCAIYRNTSSFDLVRDIRDRVKWIEGDVTDVTSLDMAMDGVKKVIHTAGVVSMDSRCKKQMYEVNVEGTANMINLSLDSGVNRFVHISSVITLGAAKKGSPIDESSDWHENTVKSDYALTKYLGEIEVRRGIAEGLDAAIVYPPFVLGAGSWSYGPNTIYSRIYNGLNFYPIGSGGVVDVRDLARMVVNLVNESSFKGKSVICSSGNISHYDLFCMIAKEFGRAKPRYPATLFWTNLGIFWEYLATLFTGKERLVTKQALSIASQSFQYDNSFSVEEFGFEYTALEKTVRDTCQCYLKTRRSSSNSGILSIID